MCNGYQNDTTSTTFSGANHITLHFTHAVLRINFIIHLFVFPFRVYSSRPVHDNCQIHSRRPVFIHLMRSVLHASIPVSTHDKYP